MSFHVPPGIKWPKSVRKMTKPQVQYLNHLNAVKAKPEAYDRYAEVLNARMIEAYPPKFNEDGSLAVGQRGDFDWRADVDIDFDRLESKLV